MDGGDTRARMGSLPAAHRHSRSTRTRRALFRRPVPKPLRRSLPLVGGEHRRCGLGDENDVLHPLPRLLLASRRDDLVHREGVALECFEQAPMVLVCLGTHLRARRWLSAVHIRGDLLLLRWGQLKTLRQPSDLVSALPRDGRHSRLCIIRELRPLRRGQDGVQPFEPGPVHGLVSLDGRRDGLNLGRKTPGSTLPDSTAPARVLNESARALRTLLSWLFFWSISA